VKEYIKQYPDRHISYHKNPSRLGMVGNRNKLLELKKGEYFIFLSDDDKFYNQKSLRTIYDGLIKYNLDVCYGKYITFNENSEI
jgi:glycosyltransferase involved in cell wall biosynthesis